MGPLGKDSKSGSKQRSILAFFRGEYNDFTTKSVKRAFKFTPQTVFKHGRTQHSRSRALLFRPTRPPEGEPQRRQAAKGGAGGQARGGHDNDDGGG